MTDDELAEMEELWAKGLTAREIAEEMGYSRSYVCELVHGNRNRFPYRIKRHSKKEMRAWAAMVIDGSFSYKRAAYRAGVHINTMKRWVKLTREGRL
jgi:transposase